ncbi:MAG: glycosyltransferase family 39 protein [Cruoricaptor ignavus]|nr:glycosyltransferase family 39 protein [Cruoricaptor ignavus]
MKQNILLSKTQILFLYIGFSVVYVLGLLVPLMQNDSAQHASMAMRMALNNDFLNLYKGENPYLDKPHMHFWLSAISMKLFGINHIAYRIPALLCIVLGAFSTKKLADLLYPKNYIGDLAALIFLSAQTIILSAHDVRTDAVLTGFVIFGIWQFTKFIKTQSWLSAALAGLGAAVAFSSKGLMPVVIIGFSVFSYLLYSREWWRFFNLKLLISAFIFFVGISPVLYAYHHQFGEEGIRFILFGQSVDRLTATGFEKTSPDYFFFFHTLLWAFLPFSLLFYLGVFARSKFFIQNKFKKIEGKEFLTLGGFWLVMLVFSTSQFKLPHYLNGLMAVLAVLTASYLQELFLNQDKKKIKILWLVQLVVITASVVGVILLIIAFTGLYNPILLFVTVLGFVFLFLNIIRKDSLFTKYALVSLWFAVAVNLFLNTQFYPVLTQFQGGLKLAEYVNKNNIDKENIYMLSGNESWAFDFYTKKNTPRVTENQLKKGDIALVYDDELKNFKRKYSILRTEKNFRITRLSLKFLNPKKRAEQLSETYLVKIED